VRSNRLAGLILGPGAPLMVCLGLFLLVAAALWSTAGLTNAPKEPWLARDAIYPDYPVPVASTSPATDRITRVLSTRDRKNVQGRGHRYHRLIVASKPIAYWPLDDRGSVMTDRVGDHDGVHPRSARPSGRAGSRNRFMRYPKGQRHISVSGGRLSGMRQMSVEFWVRNRDLGHRAFLISKAAGVTRKDSEWWVEWRRDNRIGFNVWDRKGRVAEATSSASYNGRWHHVVGTYDGRKVLLYVDGAVVASAPQRRAVPSTQEPIALGSLASGGPLTFRGDLDEVAIYRLALGPAKIERHFFAGEGPLPGRDELHAFSADTVAWQLYPSAWRAHAKWQVSFSKGDLVRSVYVNGRRLNPSILLPVTVPSAPIGQTFEVPKNVVGDTTKIEVVGGKNSSIPSLALFMTRGSRWTAPTISSGRRVKDSQSSIQSKSESKTTAWWERHLGLVIMIAFGLDLLLAVIIRWSFVQIKNLGLERGQWIVFGAVIVAMLLLATITTVFDLQIFKGEAERYWLYGPAPGLTLSGYGPILDALFVLPMLPYLIVSKVMGMSSEFALNLAMRIPLIVGSVFMIGATARLVSCLGLDRRAKRIAFYGLVLNPVIIEMTLWTPEALIVGLLVVGVVLVFEKRPISAGAMYGLAVAAKYWPLFAGPFLLLYVWRTQGKTAALRWFGSSAAVTSLLLIVYWGFTYLQMGSLVEFIRLLHQRLPYFAGSQAASYSTVWSLYNIPRRILASASLGGWVTNLEIHSFLILLALFALVVGLFVGGRPTKPRTLMAVAAVLTLAASVNSLSVAGFALWSIPFLIAGFPYSSRAKWLVASAVAAWSSGVLVTLFIEPVTYWLLHTSRPLDHVATTTASWMQAHVINVPVANAFGFLFCLGLALISFALMFEMSATMTWFGSNRRSPFEISFLADRLRRWRDDFRADHSGGS
jgi:Concanavalin A-like lectin/glucanases superfamily/Glycosyltransferase family 87